MQEITSYLHPAFVKNYTVLKTSLTNNVTASIAFFQNLYCIKSVWFIVAICIRRVQKDVLSPPRATAGGLSRVTAIFGHMLDTYSYFSYHDCYAKYLKLCMFNDIIIVVYIFGMVRNR